MTRTSLDELVELDLDGIREAHVHIVSGAVAATAGPAPGHLRVRFDADAPVDVTFEDGVLEVRRDLPRSLLFLREDVIVELVAPEDVLVRVGVVSASAAVRGFRDRVDVQAVSGPVTLDDLGGPVRAKTVSGDIEARDLRDALTANSVSGDVALVDGSCAELEVKTVSGDVVLDLRLDPAGSYRVNTLSGNVTARVDADDPRVQVRTLSGKVSVVRSGGE